MSALCPTPSWRPRALVLLQLCSLALLASWIPVSGKAAWHQLDIPVFRLLNGSLGQLYGWDLLWALLSTRLADLIAALLMLLSLITPGLVFARLQLRRALLVFIALLVVTLLVRTLFTRFIDGLGLQHASPSVALADDFSLSAAFPAIERILEIKDRSSRSFPGDHASVLLLWAAFLSLFTRGKRLLWVWLVCVFLLLPRLVAGAHWLSDNLVGGGFVVMQTLAWGYCTPLGRWIYHLLSWAAQPGWWLMQRLPLIKHTALADPQQSR